jgi:hypothetical protein
MIHILLFPLYFVLAELTVASLIGFVLCGLKIRPLFYWLFALSSWLVTLTAYPMAFVTPLFMNAQGRLPWWLNWYQMPDNPLWGDDLWKLDKPNYSKYMLALTYQLRNAAQGYDQWLKVDVSNLKPSDIKVYGKLNISDSGSDNASGNAGAYLLVGGGVFQFRAVIPCGFSRCINIGMGWRLEPIVKGYPSATLGALIATPFRLFHFL